MPAVRFEVGDLHLDARHLPDGDRLVDARQQPIRLVTHVRRVDAIGRRHEPGQLRDLIGAGVPARLVGQPRRHADHAVFQCGVEQFGHASALAPIGGARCLRAHHSGADAAVSGEGGHVHRRCHLLDAREEVAHSFERRRA
jgi:hypothetical protein